MLPNSSSAKASHRNLQTRALDPGNSPDNALKLPVFEGRRRFRGSVSKRDNSDYFRLTILQTSDLNVGLTRLRTSGVGLSLQLLDRRQKSIGSILSTMDLPPSLFSGTANSLQPGQYFVRVFYAPNFSFPEVSAGKAKYRLTINLKTV